MDERSPVVMRSKRQRVARLGGLALVMLVVAMALLPLTATDVSAKKRDDFSTITYQVQDPGLANQIAVDPSLLDPEVAESLVTPTPNPDGRVIQVDDPILVEPGLIPTLDHPIAAASVYLNKFACADDHDANYYDLAANCLPFEAQFDITGGTGVLDSYTGQFIAADVVAGDITVSEKVPDGFGEPVVFCKLTDAQGFEGESYLAAVAGGTIVAALGGAEMLYCDWFNIEDGDGTIYVNKLVCPPGFDAYNANYYELAAACHGDGNGFAFALTNSDGSLVAEQTTGDLTDHALQFTELAPGDFVLQETLPAGYGDPIVNCKNISQIDLSESDDFQPELIDAAMPVSLDGDTDLYCDWFNVPTGHGSITITKWNCPAGIVPAELDRDAYATLCTELANDVTFTLGQEGQSDQSQNTGENGTDGQVAFDDVAPGAITVTETIPAGYGAPVVFCGWGAITWLNGGLVAIDGIVTPDGVVDGVLTHDFLASEGMACDWFNIPAPSDTSITIYKFTCPVGYDFAAPGANPQADCTFLTNGVTFTLSNGVDLPLVTDTGDSINGAVFWGGLYPGDYEVTETLPANTADTYVTCQWIEVTGAYKYESLAPYAIDGAVGNRIQLSVLTGEQIVCQWYNAPGYDGGDLTVVKFWCDGSLYDPESCEIYGGGADFVLTATSGEGDPVFFTTGGDGTATLHLPAGTWNLQESGRAWCKAESSDLDGYGHVLTSDGHESVVYVYNCGPGKKKEPPVKRFPNTGAGEAARQTPILSLEIALVGMLVLGSIGGGVALRRDRA